jgi:hypothetical protein
VADGWVDWLVSVGHPSVRVICLATPHVLALFLICTTVLVRVRTLPKTGAWIGRACVPYFPLGVRSLDTWWLPELRRVRTSTRTCSNTGYSYGEPSCHVNVISVPLLLLGHACMATVTWPFPQRGPCRTHTPASESTESIIAVQQWWYRELMILLHAWWRKY